MYVLMYCNLEKRDDEDKDSEIASRCVCSRILEVGDQPRESRPRHDFPRPLSLPSSGE